jgi:integrase
MRRSRAPGPGPDQIPRPAPLLRSALIAANLNPKIIQARLGHATLAETMDTYGHRFPDSEDLGRTAVDLALARAFGGTQAEQRRNQGTA